MTKTWKTLLLTAALVMSIAAPAAAQCGSAADIDPAAPGASLRAARVATLCLLNAERARHGLSDLRFNRKLARAGTAHARDMVQNHYFSHTSESGQNFVQRILATDYVGSAVSWALGEDLAWGDAAASTPRQVVTDWMGSVDHRRNILQPRFDEVGIGIVVGVPVTGVPEGATYAAEFGGIGRH